MLETLKVGYNDYILASYYGLGDTYLVAALCQAFKQKYCLNGEKLMLVVKEKHVDLAKMFPGIDQVGWLTDEQLRSVVPLNDKPVPSPGRFFYVHPSVVSVRPDYCVAASRMSDAAMYALILGLHPETPLSLPVVPEEAKNSKFEGLVTGQTAVLVTKTNSWPDIPEFFWAMLTDALHKTGWKVVRNDPKLPLRYAIPYLEQAGWVIGANCGFMQMVVSSRARCRKTILTQAVYPDVDTSYRHPLPFSSTMEYRRFRKVDGNKYDIEEFRVDGSQNYSRVCAAISQGRNALGPAPKTEPLTVIDLETTPGDLIDRLTVLWVKRDKLPHKAYLLYREIAVLEDLRERLTRKYPAVYEKEAELCYLNVLAWDNNEILINTYADQNYAANNWYIDNDISKIDEAEDVLKAFGKAHRANQRRVQVKNEIDAICGAGITEVKSYL